LTQVGSMTKRFLKRQLRSRPKQIKGVEEPNRINFSLTPNEPFPTGDYKVDIYLNDELAKTVEFKIK
jgi:hypothetical protein